MSKRQPIGHFEAQARGRRAWMTLFYAEAQQRDQKLLDGPNGDEYFTRAIESSTWAAGELIRLGHKPRRIEP